VSSEPAAGGPQQWFEYYDDTVVGDPCSEADHAFLAGLRARAVARAWPCEAWDTFCDHDDELGKRALKVGVWLDDPVRLKPLVAFGLVFDGDRIVGDRIDREVPWSFQGLAEAQLEFSGPVDSLVERAGEWFESLLTWPIEYREWVDLNSDMFYHEWVLANVGETLLVNASRMPARRPDRVELIRGIRDEQTHGRKGIRGAWPWTRR